MLVHTQNSIYQITPKSHNFTVTKIADSGKLANPSIKTNATFETDSIFVRVGERAKLGELETSPVIKVS